MPDNRSALTKKLARILSPLTKSEAKRAVDAAVAYLQPELECEGRSRFRALGAELHVTRPTAKGTALRRLVRVVVVDYSSRRHVQVVVDRGRIAHVRELDWQPAFSSEEVAEAEAIAAQNPQFRKIARRRGVFTSAYAPGSNPAGARRIGLHYIVPRKNAPSAYVGSAEVDLVEQKLIDAVIVDARRDHG